MENKPAGPRFQARFPTDLSPGISAILSKGYIKGPDHRAASVSLFLSKRPCPSHLSLPLIPPGSATTRRAAGMWGSAARKRGGAKPLGVVQFWPRCSITQDVPKLSRCNLMLLVPIGPVIWKERWSGHFPKYQHPVKLLWSVMH